MAIRQGDTVKADGKTWKVSGVGVSENGATYVHLKSETDGVQQKNGFRPMQCCGWLRDERLWDAP